MSGNEQRMTPEQAVEDWLRRMGEVSTSEPAGGVPSGTRLTRSPNPAVLSSMKFVKRRTIPGRQVHALSYSDTAAGDKWFWIMRLIEDAEGSWRVCGGGGGSGESPEREAPWINLAGSWGKYGLALGGRVAGRGADRAASARLRIGDSVFVDDVRNGVVTFVTSDPTAGTAAIELLAQDGSILWGDDVQLDD